MQTRLRISHLSFFFYLFFFFIGAQQITYRLRAFWAHQMGLHAFFAGAFKHFQRLGPVSQWDLLAKLPLIVFWILFTCCSLHFYLLFLFLFFIRWVSNGRNTGNDGMCGPSSASESVLLSHFSHLQRLPLSGHLRCTERSELAFGFLAAFWMPDGPYLVAVLQQVLHG
ncbi:uncharacterized protein K452DRAFT_42570 [Aplosporella prunicola CBS 121167]|uniref:Uncharacterized protein n=1 Tax=Aplosporella prunicola CBS 121167 TaxID=1176127 RepID=A0A6A6B9L1_9PEZI|nr:uncharacterized protein K452DRAFT_42570 [Aplosporella prunicola CBS 121167]KAF2140899.1 hypothetical protein K452DRAFT_42570 [Aplosporella prunicola CBS 121167]